MCLDFRGRHASRILILAALLAITAVRPADAEDGALTTEDLVRMASPAIPSLKPGARERGQWRRGQPVCLRFPILSCAWDGW